MGAAPKYVRSGATIPAMAYFQKLLSLETTVFAFGLPTNNLHAPDEHTSLAMYHLAAEAYVRFLHELGAAGEDAAAGDGRTEL